MNNQVDASKRRDVDQPQEKHFDVRDLTFDCDTEDHSFLCSLKYAEE